MDVVRKKTYYPASDNVKQVKREAKAAAQKAQDTANGAARDMTE